MTLAMTHDDAFASLEAVALGALSAEEERDVLAHVATCDQCAPALAALRDVAAQLAHSAPGAAMDADRRAALRSRLQSRATGADEKVAIIAPLMSGVMPRLESPGRARPSPALAWFAIAAGIALVASTTLLAVTWIDRARLRGSLDSMTANQATLDLRLDSLSRQLADNQRVLQSLGGPRVRVVNLGTTAPVGRMFWDQAAGRWTLFAHLLPPTRPGRTYQLWLVSRGARISAGTFQPDARGDAMVSAQYSLPADALDAIAVTDEPAGGAAQPTGTVILATPR